MPREDTNFRPDQHRPLTHPLKKGDQLFFMHIPKTAGTTLVEIIRKQFMPEDYYSHRKSEEAFTPAELKSLETARFVRGHRPYNFQQYFPRRPVIITMLRDPAARLRSNYVHLKTYEPHRLAALGKHVGRTDGEPVTLEEYITLPSQHNRQTYDIAGMPGAQKSFPPESVLSVAKTHLESLAFFGITERFDESLRLLMYTFNWELPAEYESLNKAIASHDMTPELEAGLRKANELDYALYDYALKLFDFRIEKMQDELKQQGKSL